MTLVLLVISVIINIIFIIFTIILYKKFKKSPFNQLMDGINGFLDDFQEIFENEEDKKLNEKLRKW